MGDDHLKRPGGPQKVFDSKNKKPRVFAKNSIYCEEHAKLHKNDYEKFERKYDHKKRYDSRWDKVRNIYFKSHPLCEECEKNGIVKNGDLVHHRVPIENGGDKYLFENLETVCNSCHQKLHVSLRDGTRNPYEEK